LVLPHAPAAAQDPPASIGQMTSAAQKFMGSLSAEQREIALKPFDDEERTAFKPVPFPVVGLRYDGMSDAQIALLHELLKTGLSAAGYEKAAEIILLDDYLLELEQGRGRAPAFHGTRNYNIVIFGEPAPGATWSWRVHGHHLYLSFTIVEGKLFATAPAFFGAEPHDITEGPRAPQRILADEEDLGANLWNMLSDEQKRFTVIATQMPNDMFSGRAARVESMGAAGIPWSKLSDDQRAQLKALVLEYCNNSADDLRFERLKRVEDGGWENLSFAWIGDPARGQRKYYRVTGPLFLIEYCAVALTPNHVHTVWRDYNGDYGRDILAEHMTREPH
jgi:hypothetical protein